MCTAVVHRGKDFICGMNMDINAEAFRWQVMADADAFCVAMKPVIDTSQSKQPRLPGYMDFKDILRIHGVSAKGIFVGQLSNMGAKDAPFEVSPDAYPLYGLADHLLAGRMNLAEAERIAGTKRLINMPSGGIDIPDVAMHAVIADKDGQVILLEPGTGMARLTGRYAVVSNFPMLVLPTDLDEEHAGYYGLDRYRAANRMLSEADDDFSAEDALRILKAVKQTGHWATRVSFVWSRNEHAVYYVLENDFEHVTRHVFA